MRLKHCSRFLALTLVVTMISFMLCEACAVYTYAAEPFFAEGDADGIIIIYDGQEELSLDDPDDVSDAGDPYEDDAQEGLTVEDIAVEEITDDPPAEAEICEEETTDGTVEDENADDGAEEDDEDPGSLPDTEAVTDPVVDEGGNVLIIYGTTLCRKQKFNLAGAIKARYTGTGKIKKYKITKQDGVSKLEKPVIKIDSKGMVTAVRNGICLVTALDKGGGELACAEIEVKDPPSMNAVPLMTLKGGTLSILDYLNNTAYGTSSYSFKSSKPKVASVDKNGIVTAKKSGKTKITITIRNSDPDTMNFYKAVKVSATVKVKLPSISAKKVTLKAGKSKTISIKKAKGVVTWSQDEHTDVASVTPTGASSQKCVIKAGNNGGVTVITASLEDGNIFRCQVIVDQLGSRYYDDVGVNGKYDKASAKKIVSGFNAYRKKKKLPILKTDAALTAMAAANARSVVVGNDYIYPIDGKYDILYSGLPDKKFKSFNEFIASFEDEYKEMAYSIIQNPTKKVGCVMFYDKDNGMWITCIMCSN